MNQTINRQAFQLRSKKILRIIMIKIHKVKSNKNILNIFNQVICLSNQNLNNTWRKNKRFLITNIVLIAKKIKLLTFWSGMVHFCASRVLKIMFFYFMDSKIHISKKFLKNNGMIINWEHYTTEETNHCMKYLKNTDYKINLKKRNIVIHVHDIIKIK